MSEISIGDLIARLKLDSTDFARGLQQATQTLQQFAQAKDSIIQNMARLQQQGQATGQSFNQFNQQINQTNQQFNQTNQTLHQMNQTFNTTVNVLNQARQAAQGTGSAWQSILQIAAGIGLATTIQGIIRGLINFASESVQLAAKMQDLHRSFTALEGSGEAANRTLNFLFQTSQRIGIGFTEAVEGFRRLEAGARGTVLTSADLQRAFEGLATGARAMGLSNQQVGSAVQALEQILTKGRLQAEELVRQLGNAVPGALQTTAQVLGVTTERLRAMAEAGLIPGTVAVTAFTEGMRQLGNAAGPLTGLTQTFVNLKNETLAWMTAIGESIGKTLQPWLDKITEISKALRDLLGIRAPGTTALGTGAATPAGPYTAATQFPLAESPYTALIRQEAQRSAIDPGLFSQLIRAESGFDPIAKSRAGALGLGQLMLPTAQGLEMGVTEQTLLEPERNLRLAAKYLADMLDKFRGFNDQVKLALAAYNAGPGAVENLLNAARRAGTPTTFEAIAPQLPQETQQYVARVLQPVTTGPAGGAAAGQLTPSAAAEAQAQVIKTWQAEIAKALTQFKELQAVVTGLADPALNFNGILSRNITQSAEAVLKPLLAVQQALATIPGLANQVDGSLKQQVIDATRQASIWKEGLLTDEHRRDLLRQQVEQMEQLRLQQQAQERERRLGAEDAARFARVETERLQQARLEDRPRLAGLTLQQQIAEYQQRLQALRQLTADAARQLEIDREQRQARREAIQNLDIFGLMLSPEQEADLKEQARAQRQRIQEFARTGDLLGLELSPEQERRRRSEAIYLEDLQRQVERLQVPGGDVGRLGALFGAPTRLDVELQQRTRDRQGRDIFETPQAREQAAQLQAQVRQQERLIAAAQLFEELGTSVGNAWTQALLGIANGTQTVAQAFRAMGQSIMQTLIQMASQEAWRALIQLGVRAIVGAATSSVGGSAGTGGAASSENTSFIGSTLGRSSAASSLFSGLQTGGIVRRPSFHLLGEAGPEAVVPLSQMSQLLSRAPSAGGQAAGGLTIINVGSEGEAQRQKGQQEAMGRRVIINTVLSDLSAGESSKINRAIRTLQR